VQDQEGYQKLDQQGQEWYGDEWEERLVCCVS
jgi:hypothetical protein